jgi:uncharacterized protein (TIGR02996 family)
MSMHDAFLHDILAHPDDDAPRLIYADWLDEHGDPRGEFIRVQCALAQLSDEDPHRWPLQQREQELLREHEAKWLPKDGGSACVFRRGFVEECTLIPQDFLSAAERLFEQTPLQHVCLRERTYSALSARVFEGFGLQHVAQSPHLARLRGLSLSFEFPLSSQELRTLSESPYLDHLTDLKLCVFNLEDDALNTWEKALLRPTLRRLDLSGSGGVNAPFLHALAQTPRLANLRFLSLARTTLGSDNLPILANSPVLTNLRELNLNDNVLSHEAATVLAGSRLLPQLETLHLDSNLLGDAGALALRDWPSLPRLSRLSLGHNQIFATGVQTLADAPALRDLISLSLFGNISGDAGAAALASSDWTRLHALNLRFNGVGDASIRALAHSPAFSHLTRLDLTANRITSAGAQALAESPALPRLARLDLPRNDIAAAEQQRLRQRFGAFVYF